MRPKRQRDRILTTFRTRQPSVFRAHQFIRVNKTSVCFPRYPGNCQHRTRRTLAPDRKWSPPRARRTSSVAGACGSFVPFTIIGECSTDTPMQTNLSNLVRQTNQSFASVLLASSWIGFSHPHHSNSTNARYHVNLAKPSRVRQIEDNSWYTPARSPQFDDSMGS